MALLPVGPNPRWRPAPSWIVSNGHISAMGSSDSLHVWFSVRVFGVADRMTLLAVGENAKWWPAAILENVEWPYFFNGSCNSLRV